MEVRFIHTQMNQNVRVNKTNFHTKAFALALALKQRRNATRKSPIDGLQSIPRDSNDKDVAAMLDELTIEANEESFVIVLQHGGNDVT